MDLAGRIVSVSAYGRAVELVGDRHIAIPAAFALGAGGLDVVGPGQGAIGADLGTDVAVLTAPGACGYASYEIRLRDRSTDQTLHAGLAVAW